MDKKTIELISKVKIIIENNIKNNNNQEFYIEEQYYSDFDDGFLDINRLRLLGLLYNICIDLNVTYTYIEDKEKYSYYIFKPHKKVWLILYVISINNRIITILFSYFINCFLNINVIFLLIINIK